MADSDHQDFSDIPRYLRRPEFREVSRAALEAVDPDLRDVEMEYILQKLKLVGQQLLSVAVTATIIPPPPRGHLPRDLDVVVNDLAADAPTHLFAVSSNSNTHISLRPGHGLVLAAHCANIAPLPYSNPAPPAEVGSTVTLPVYRLRVPDPDTFPILFRYLYTKRRDHLLASLLPMPPHDETQSSLEQLSQELTAFSGTVLVYHLAMVHALWMNMSALGVFDGELWEGIEIAWEVLLGALAMRTQLNWRMERTVNIFTLWYIISIL